MSDLDLLEAADRGAVEAHAFLDVVLAEDSGGGRKCDASAPGTSVMRRSIISTSCSFIALTTSAGV
ncbi:MAG: hypothetical protein R3C97_02310 [Geminicoccaceae bacterium]